MPRDDKQRWKPADFMPGAKRSDGPVVAKGNEKYALEVKKLMMKAAFGAGSGKPKKGSGKRTAKNA